MGLTYPEIGSMGFGKERKKDLYVERLRLVLKAPAKALSCRSSSSAGVFSSGTIESSPIIVSNSDSEAMKP
ncbi:hypothetical protein Tco_0915843 [Tanacetum coccineum]